MTYKPAIDQLQDQDPTKIYMMMWFDNSPIPLQDKILRAAAYYHTKYNREPNVCKVPISCQVPTDWKELVINGIRIVLDSTVLANHFYIGQEENVP